MLARFNRNLRHVLITTVVIIGWSANTEALSFPGSGAAIIAGRQVSPEDTDSVNPFSCPFFLDMVRSLARSGLPSGFFLGVEGKHRAPGLDLRAILLYEAGVLKAPVRLLLPSTRGNKGPNLNLSMPSMLDPDGLDQGQGGVINNQSSLQRAKLGAAAEQLPSLSAFPPTLTPSLSLDFNKFQNELTQRQNKDQLPQQASSDVPKINFPLTGGASVAQSSEFNAFRLLTVNLDKDSPGQKVAGRNDSLSVDPEAYRGTLFVTTPGAVRSIEGRVFFVKKGPILAVVKGKPLTVETQLGQISLLPGTSCMIDFPNAELLRVRILECAESRLGAGVRFKVEGKGEELRLSAGEQFLLSNRKLGQVERTIVQGSAAGSEASEQYWAKGKFSPGDFADKDVLFQASLLKTVPAESRFTINELRSRLK